MNVLGCDQKCVSIAEVQVRDSLKYLWCGMSSLVSSALLHRCAAPAVPRLLMEIQLMVFG